MCIINHGADSSESNTIPPNSLDFKNITTKESKINFEDLGLYWNNEYNRYCINSVE
jgi:hypothetical protein